MHLEWHWNVSRHEARFVLCMGLKKWARRNSFYLFSQPSSMRYFQLLSIRVTGVWSQSYRICGISQSVWKTSKSTRVAENFYFVYLFICNYSGQRCNSNFFYDLLGAKRHRDQVWDEFSPELTSVLVTFVNKSYGKQEKNWIKIKHGIFPYSEQKFRSNVEE